MIEPIRTYKIEEHFNQGRFIEGRTLKIFIDDDPMNPRIEFDNFGKMVCFHRDYNLGDKIDLHSSDFGSWDELKEYLVHEMNAEIILPLYLYDHSGLSISTGSFHDRWDSGMIGFTYATKDDILKNYMVSELTDEIRKKAEDLLVSEVEEYDQYLRGEVYGYELEDKNGEIIDSCWGFFGDIKYILEEFSGFAEV